MLKVFNLLSIIVFVFFTQTVFAAKGSSTDPFAALGGKAEEGSASIMNVAIPIFVLVLVALIVLRALNVIGNRLLVISSVSLFAISLVPTVVNWAIAS